MNYKLHLYDSIAKSRQKPILREVWEVCGHWLALVLANGQRKGNCSGVGQTGGLPWSLDILQTKREPIPKGLHLSGSQGSAPRATLG